MYLSIARTTSDQRATSPAGKNLRHVNNLHCGKGPPEALKNFYLTSKCGHESLNSAGSGSENEVAVDSRGDGNGESEGAHDQPSHCQVDQDVVERLPELLVLGCHQQCQAIDRSPGADQEEHVQRQYLEHDRIYQVILRVFKRTPDNPSPVGHRDVEVLSFSAIRLNSSIPSHLHCCVLLLGLQKMSDVLMNARLRKAVWFLYPTDYPTGKIGLRSSKVMLK